MSDESQWRSYFQLLRQRMVRLKETNSGDLKTELRRCLSTRALTFLGAGNTIGVGIYVLLGIIAKENAGPSAVLCFLIAIAVTLMNALVYAEFSSSVTQTGAAYLFFYKVGGEFFAFLCGWLMILSSIFSGCVSARAWSGLLDSFFNHTIQGHTKDIFGEIQFGSPFANSLDLMAFLFQMAMTTIVSCNVTCSSILNTGLGILTISVLVLVAIAGPIFGDVSNFVNVDHGGFFPFGLFGVVKGASLAIYACSGFEVIAMSAEEAKNPQRSVPTAIILELMIVALVYVGATVGILFLIPYWLINTKAPLPSAFEYNGIIWGKYLVTLGPLFSFCNLQMLNLYGLSRIVYRMALDGLFFPWFLHVNKTTGVPINSVLFVGILIAVLSLCLDLSFLVGVTILLMLITFVFLGSALIKLKIPKPNSPSDVVQKTEHKPENNIPISLGPSGQTIPFTDFKDAVDNAIKENGAINTTNSNRLPNISNGISNSDVRYEKEDEFCSDRVEEESDGEDLTLFEREKGEEPASKANRSCGDKESLSTSMSVVCAKDSHTFRARLRDKCSSFVPGVLSDNVVIFMHWSCCMGLAVQMNHGWNDLVSGSVVSLTAFSLFVFLLVLLMFLLWLRTAEDSTSGFKTPLMPVVPTLSMLSSCILLFSSVTLNGFMELVVLVVIGSALYLVLVWLDMKTATDSGGIEDQTMSLILNTDGSDDNEL